MTLQITHTAFPDGTILEHSEIEEILLWDKCKDWRKAQAKRKPKARIIPSWEGNKMRKVV